LYLYAYFFTGEDMTKDEALRLALEAMEMFCEHGAILRPIEIRDAIKAALQARDEPVAWYHVENNKVFFTASPSDDLIGKYWTPLYTTPPQRKPLTDEEIVAIVREESRGSAISRDGSTSLRIARAIEAAHGIKGEA